MHWMHLGYQEVRGTCKLSSPLPLPIPIFLTGSVLFALSLALLLSVPTGASLANVTHSLHLRSSSSNGYHRAQLKVDAPAQPSFSTHLSRAGGGGKATGAAVRAAKAAIGRFLDTFVALPSPPLPPPNRLGLLQNHSPRLWSQPFFKRVWTSACRWQAGHSPVGNCATTLYIHHHAFCLYLLTISHFVSELHVVFVLVLYECVPTSLACKRAHRLA